MVQSSVQMGDKRVARIGFGGMSVSHAFGHAPRDEALALLQKAIDMGCTAWDTADAYGNGHSEELLGEVLRRGDNRQKVFLVTKWGISLKDRTLVASAEYAPVALDASIQRLGSAPDAWILHRIPKDVSIESVVEAMDDLRKEGKTRFIGLGECSAATLRRASKVAKIDFIESEYSPFCLDIEETGVLDVCKELGVRVLAFSPLGKGFLTGRFKEAADFGEGDPRLHHFPRLSQDNFEKNYTIVEELDRLAKVKGCTSGQLALAWALHQSDLIIPIPGTKNEKYLAENFAALRVELSEGELKDLREVINANQPVGDRYTKASQDMLDK